MTESIGDPDGTGHLVKPGTAAHPRVRDGDSAITQAVRGER